MARPMTDRQPVVDLVEVRHPVDAPMGPTILAGLFARTWLAEHSDDDVLDTTWVMAADVHEERHTLPGAADPSRIRLHQGGGLRRTVDLTTVTAAYASVCDGELSARVAAAAIAGVLGVEAEAVREEIVAFVRDTARDGLLVSASPSP